MRKFYPWQCNAAVLYVLEDQHAALVLHRFYLIGTGDEFVPNIQYKSFLGTVMLHDGGYVIHVFDGGEL
jgi:hypothetical protein